MDNEYNPDKNTTTYTALVRRLRVPNKYATGSNENNPIKPQFKAPINTITNAVFNDLLNCN